MKKKRVRLGDTDEVEEGIKRTIDWYLENKEGMEKVIKREYLEFYRRNYGGESYKKNVCVLNPFSGKKDKIRN